MTLLTNAHMRFNRQFTRTTRFTRRGPIRNLIIRQLNSATPPVNRVGRSNAYRLQDLFVSEDGVNPYVRRANRHFIGIVRKRPHIIRQRVLQFGVTCNGTPRRNTEVERAARVPTRRDVTNGQLLTFVP